MKTVVRTLPAVLATVLAGLNPQMASAQVLLTPPQLSQLVSRVALYPDPLLAQVFTASSYSEQIPDAARWAEQHNYLTGDNLAGAINQDRLPWDPSVLALLPFPSVLNMMASDIFWTRQLGDAVLGQRPDVMDAVQAMRQKARDFGYLQNTPQYNVNVSSPGMVEIMPVDPALYFVPVYDPLLVFGRPRIGVALGITFGPGIQIGVAFGQWGWGRSGFGWPSHSILLDGRSWERTRENHATYSHAYSALRRLAGPRVERHEARPAAAKRQEERKDRER